MSWELSIRVVYQSEDHSVMAFPGSDDEPYYSFDDLDELVEFIKAVGGVTKIGDLDAYAEVVKREGEVVQQTLSRRRANAFSAVEKALERARGKHRRQVHDEPVVAVE